MPVDSFKFLPRSFRLMFEDVHIEVDGPVWAPFEKPELPRGCHRG